MKHLEREVELPMEGSVGLGEEESLAMVEGGMRLEGKVK